MPKNIFHDIVPPEKRSIRNLKLPTRKIEIEDVSEEKKSSKEIKESRVSKKETRSYDEESDFDIPKAPKKGVWFLAFLSFSALVFAVLFLIAKTDINIKTKRITLSLNENISALKDGAELLYSSIAFSDSSSLEVSATEQKEVSTKASGTVVIYNTQNVSQILIAKTRLETNTGLIFLLDKRVVVPAQKIVSGKAVPGSVEVSVTAEKAGSQYNVGLVDLTVPAFKGEAKFNSVYARAKKTIGGGNLGLTAFLSDKDKADAKKKLEESLSQKMLSKAKAELPSNSVIFDGAYSVKFEDPSFESKGDKVVVKEQASFSGYVFEKKNLVTNLAKLKNQDVFVDESVAVDPEGVSVSNLMETGNTLKFNIKGDLHVSYTFDAEKLKNDFKNKSKDDVLNLLKNYPGIASAEVSTYPLWKTPDNVNKININIE